MKVILTTHNASEEMKEKMTNMSNEEVTEILKQAIKNIGIESTKIHKAQKTNQGIKIWCISNKEVKELYNIEWNNLFEGIEAIE